MPVDGHPRPQREPEAVLERLIGGAADPHRQPHVPRVPQIGGVPPVRHEDEPPGQSRQRHHEAPLREKRRRPEDLVAPGAWVPHRLPRAHHRLRRVRHRPIRRPAGAAGGDHVVGSPVLEHRRRLPPLADENPAHVAGDVEVVAGEGPDVELAVVVGGVDEVGGAVVVLEDGHVAALAAVGALAVEVLEGPRGGGADRHADGGLGVVGVVNVHPHHVLPRPVVEDDLRPLEDVPSVEVVGGVRFFSGEDDPLVCPRPQVLGGVAADPDNVNLVEDGKEKLEVNVWGFQRLFLFQGRSQRIIVSCCRR